MNPIDAYLQQNPTLIPAVVCYPIREAEILLMRRIKTSNGLGQDLLSGIGGKIGDQPEYANETAVDAVIRECYEEIEIRPIEFGYAGRARFLWTNKPDWNMDVHIYRISNWEGTPTATAVAQPEWHPIHNIPYEYMWEDSRYLLPEILANHRLDAIFLYGDQHSIVDYRMQTEL